MTDTRALVYCGFFPDFALPTILFFGEREAFKRLSEMLALASGRPKSRVHLKGEPFINAGNTDIALAVMAESTGMRRIDHRKFEWGLSTEQCASFAGSLDALSRTPPASSGHCYLDCGDLDDVNVIASVGEYSVDHFKSLGAVYW